MIKKFIATSNLSFISQLRESIKSIEIEEQLDLVIHRPLGLLFSLFAIKLKFSPLQISIMSMLAGIAAGGCLYFQGQVSWVLLGGLFLTLAAILDSADGQVARMTGTASTVGMIVDGIIDNVVFISVYFGAALFFYSSYGPIVFLYAFLSGVAHSFQALVFDYYKNEVSYLYAGCDSFRNPTVEEIQAKYNNSESRILKIANKFHLNYVKEQSWVTFRAGRIKEKFESLRNNPETSERFKAEYIKRNRPIMRFWAFFGGANSHRIIIVIFSLFAAFDYYLLFNLVFMSVPVICLTFIQRRIDNKLYKMF